MIYRRSRTAGSTYFFTVNTHNRRQLLCIPENVELLRQALKYMMHRHPVEINAIVLLPDHLHCLWTLPKDDHNYSMRWMLVKSYFSRHCNHKYEGIVSKSRQSKQERVFGKGDFGNIRFKMRMISLIMLNIFTTILLNTVMYLPQ